MAEQINYNQLYGALTPLEQEQYAGYKIARNLAPSERKIMDEEAFPDFKEILDAEAAAAATKPSMWNPMNWLFPPAASAERGIPATSAAQQYFDYYSKYGDNYSDLKIPGWEKQLMQNQRFKQQQLMNRRKQNMQQTIRQAEKKRIEQEKIKTAQASQRQVDQARISRAYKEETGGQAGSYAPGGGSGAHAADASGSTYSDPFDPGGGEAQGGFIDGTNRRRNYFNGGLIDFFRYGGFSG